MKTRLLRKTMLLLCALVAGSSSVWADDYKDEITKSDVTATQGNQSITNKTYGTYTFTNSKQDNSVRMYANGVFTITAKSGYRIASVVFDTKTAPSNNPTYNVSLDSYTLDNAFATGTTTTYTGSGATTLTFSSNSNGSFYFNKITINYELAEPCTVSFSDGLSDDLTESGVGTGVVLPTRPNPAFATFVGWTTSNITIADTKSPTIYTGTYYPSSDITLYPVYSYVAYRNIDEWVEVKEAPQDGTYAICTASYFMKAAITSNRFQNGTGVPSIVNGKLTKAPADDCIWEIYKAEDTYYRIKHATAGFAAAKSSNSQGQLLTGETAETSNYSKWTITYDNGFTFGNIGKTDKYLRQNSTSGWAMYAASTGDAPRLFKHNHIEGNVTLYISSIPASSISSEINATYNWATFCSDRPLDFTGTGVEAYIVTGVNGTSIVKKRVYKVPANTGLLVTGTTDDIPVTTATTDDVDGNLLVAGAGEEVVPGSGTTYVLSADASNNAIFKTVGSYHPTVPVGKAYLVVPSASRDFFFVDGDATGIEAIGTATTTATRKVVKNGRVVIETGNGAYTLNGARVE